LEHHPRWLSGKRDDCRGFARATPLIARFLGLGGDIANFSHGQFGSLLAASGLDCP
jgi:Iap family predicted aminopeptidase